MSDGREYGGVWQGNVWLDRVECAVGKDGCAWVGWMTGWVSGWVSGWVRGLYGGRGQMEWVG